MNYRHAFHAGNVADVLKHAVLARVLTYLVTKPAPLRFIDTHAGIGRYDLAGQEAARTGEWRQGIARVVLGHHPALLAALLAPYLEAVGPTSTDGRPLSYPGSPAVAQHILRPVDRLLLCELHAEDVTALRSTTKRDKRAKVLAADGYAALKAAVPPPERRGLVLIDPPFEDRAEFKHVFAVFGEAYRRWPTGTYLIWYPLKAGTPAAPFLGALRAMALPKMVEIELFAATLLPEGGLLGSGMVVVNPPFTLPDEAAVLLPHLAACLGDPGRSWRWRVGNVSG